MMRHGEAGTCHVDARGRHRVRTPQDPELLAIEGERLQVTPTAVCYERAPRQETRFHPRRVNATLAPSSCGPRSPSTSTRIETGRRLVHGSHKAIHLSRDTLGQSVLSPTEPSLLFWIQGLILQPLHRRVDAGSSRLFGLSSSGGPLGDRVPCEHDCDKRGRQPDGFVHISYSPTSCMTICRRRGCVSSSSSTICCHVPSINCFAVNGMATDGPTSAARTWLDPLSSCQRR